ncbi:MAG: ornithine carbamoyltransferase [Bacillota bacterium]
MKDLISIRNLTTEEILGLLDFANEIKENYKKGVVYKPLKDKTVITSFPSTSLRTRISFEAGIFQLGANAINMEIDFEGKEPLEDKVGYLNCWIDYLVIRYPKQEIIEAIAENADFSVINAMSKKSHPCEILSDLQTIRERMGDLANLKFVFVGEGANISNTWFEAAAKLDLTLTQVCPAGYEVNQELFEYAKRESKGEVKITNDMEEGLKAADVILTDAWPIKDDKHEAFKHFLPYQIDLQKIKFAHKDCIVNPCPPFTRGNEIVDEVIKSKHFIGYDAKENLLHMQKAILAFLNK